MLFVLFFDTFRFPGFKKNRQVKREFELMPQKSGNQSDIYVRDINRYFDAY